jgi:uncharacterized membrane protein YfcA
MDFEPVKLNENQKVVIGGAILGAALGVIPQLLQTDLTASAIVDLLLVAALRFFQIMDAEWRKTLTGGAKSKAQQKPGWRYL